MSEEIGRLNAICEKEQCQIVFRVAKEHNWKIFLGTRKLKIKDSKNFHILTDNDIMLQRSEWLDYMQNTKVEWSLVRKDSNIRVKGDFGTIISEFVKEYTKTHEVIYL
jgi:hypothetical protein